MKKITKRYLLIGLLLITGMILGVTFMKINSKNINTKSVSITTSLIKEQIKKESKFKIINFINDQNEKIFDFIKSRCLYYFNKNHRILEIKNNEY